MKDKSEVRLEGKPVFYSILFNPMKEAAIKLGYMLTMHGSMHSDLDLIAVAWVEDASHPDKLMEEIHKCIGKTWWKKKDIQPPTKKPHYRICYTLSIMSDWFIDLSIIPPNNYIWKEEKDLKQQDMEK